MIDTDDPRARELADKLAVVRRDIDEAAKRAGRDSESVTLVAVSKKHPGSDVVALKAAGQMVFGESYVQEGVAKAEELAALGATWHFIGGLQSNKAKFLPGVFELVHSVDSAKLAQGLHNKASVLGIRQKVLLQVNLSGETQKSGIEEEGVRELAQKVMEMGTLELQGLMTMPPWDEDPEKARPYFARLREVRDNLQDTLGVGLPHLSMGMTGDFVQAIEEGATLVRIGTRIFGPRMY